MKSNRVLSGLAAVVRWRVLGLALALLAVLVTVPPEQAEAQTTQVLVSNIGQSHWDAQAVATLDVAQGFTTGSNSAGYTLTSIEIRIIQSGVIDSAVVRKTDPNTGDLVATLTGPASGVGGGNNTVGTGVQTFTAPSGTSLEPSTEYFVVFESDASPNNLRISYTRSDDEDAGGAAGWSISNLKHWRTKASTGNFGSLDEPNRIRVNGTIHDAPDSHDGQTAFTFELHFSEEFSISYKTLRDHAFTVTGARWSKPAV